MIQPVSWRAALAIALTTVSALAGCQAPQLTPTVTPGMERPRGQIRAGQVMLHWGPTFDAARANAIHATLGTRVVQGETEALQLVAVPEGQELDYCRRYREAAPELTAEPNYMVRTHHVPGSFRLATPADRNVLMTPNDPGFVATNALPTSWGLREIKADVAWDTTAGDPQVTVAVIDTGVDLTHPDLAANLDSANAVNFVETGSRVDDDFGHGTHVAGIIAAVGNNGDGSVGVAWKTRVIPIRVLGVDGTGETFDTVQAINYAVRKGASVINMSLGSPDRSDIEGQAIQAAINAGVVVVAAAGNEAASGNYLEYPAGYAGVVSVAAIGPDKKRAAFSNFNSQVTLSAPGVDIFSTVPSRFSPRKNSNDGPYGFLSGTSMAAPFVSGAAALVFSMHPNWTPDQVVARLKQTATDLQLGADDPAGYDVFFGFGLLNAARAVSN
jgi:subtilisin family serine protease